MSKTTEVLVIGGGITGVGVLFDLALRGFRCTLVERDDLSTGTSGRFHGLLHSGGRYAVKDPLTARECYEENRILRRLIPHAIEDTGGLYLSIPDPAADPATIAWPDKFYAAAKDMHIPIEELSAAALFKDHPHIN